MADKPVLIRAIHTDTCRKDRYANPFRNPGYAGRIAGASPGVFDGLSCTGYWIIRSKKRGLTSTITLSLGTEPNGGTMGTLSSRWIARGRLHQTRTTDPWQHAFRETKEIQGEKSSFVGNWPHDDPLAHLGSLRKGRRRCLLAKPPFGSHGAVRTRSVWQSP